MKTVTQKEQQVQVRDMFAGIASRYDLLNRLMSLGMDQRWRKKALEKIELPLKAKLLDIATGTGDAALMASGMYPGRMIVGMDMTLRMVRIAINKDKDGRVNWGGGNALRLPFADNSFEGVFSAFMMRNVGDTQAALDEQVRALKPGGWVVCLEMTWPRCFPMTWLFHVYFLWLTPLLGRLISGKGAAYRYLPMSVKHFIAPSELAQQMEKAGLRQVGYEKQMLGTVTIHVGEKSEES